MKWQGCKIIVLLLLIGVLIIGCQDKKAESSHGAVARKETMIKEKGSEKQAKTEGQETVDSAREDLETGKVFKSDEEQGATVLDESSNQVTTNRINDAASITQKNTTSSQKTEAHTHAWVAQTKTVNHAEGGHYETKVIREAYDVEVYAWRTLCNRCKNPETGKPLDITGHPGDHVISVCGGGYYADRVVVDTIHHDAVTEQVWVVDKAAWAETITIGYECSCGAIK